MMKKILSVFALVVLSFFLVASASASPIPVEVKSMEVNGNDVDFNDNGDLVTEVTDFEEGDSLEVEVGLKANGEAKDVEVEASIKGYEYSDYEPLVGTTHVFDMKEGKTYYKKFSLNLPKELDQDEYLLRVRITDKNHDAVEKVVKIYVDAVRHGVEIKDTDFSPSLKLKAGKALQAKVVLENFGVKDEENVKVTASISELGVSASDYVDALEADDTQATEVLYLKIPSDAKAGKYPVQVTVKYDNMKEVTAKTYTLEVLEGEIAQQETAGEKLVLTAGPESQNVVAGGSQAMYPITLTNEGKASQTYALELVAGDWADAKLSENLFVLAPGETKVAYAYITAKEAAEAGEKIFSVTVKNSEKVLKQFSLKANVVKTASSDADYSKLRKGLEVAVIALVVLLVIVGIIIGFSRMGKKDEDEKVKEYY